MPIICLLIGIFLFICGGVLALWAIVELCKWAIIIIAVYAAVKWIVEKLW